MVVELDFKIQSFIGLGCHDAHDLLIERNPELQQFFGICRLVLIYGNEFILIVWPVNIWLRLVPDFCKTLQIVDGRIDQMPQDLLF